jgi:hypothetical protein
LYSGAPVNHPTHARKPKIGDFFNVLRKFKKKIKIKIKKTPGMLF